MGLTTSDWVGVGVFGATALLAWATFSMARRTRGLAESASLEVEQTRRMAESTEMEARAVAEQATVTRASLQASIQPWLTRVTPPLESSVASVFIPSTSGVSFLPGEEPHRVYVDRKDGELQVTLWLRNVGRGVALIRATEGCLIEGRDRDDKPLIRYGFPSAAALPPGELTRLTFLVQGVDETSFLSTHRNWGEFWVSVLYTDLNTDQPMLARVHLTAADRIAAEWLFHGIEYTRSGEDAPFTSVLFDAAIPKPTGIDGWESKVVGVTRSQDDKRLDMIDLRLITPNGKPSEEELVCELTRLADGFRFHPSMGQPRWEDVHLSSGEPPHYSVLLPSSFEEKDEPLLDGVYELRWRQRYGISVRDLIEPHRFRLRNGELVVSDHQSP